ncbi:MAG: L17 family ribosomal protein [Planctomycetota bacterium]
MRHRVRGRKLGRNASHRKAMFRNMAASLIKSVRVDEDDDDRPKVAGRIVTTVAKAKELRPFVEKLVTLARKAAKAAEAAESLGTDAAKDTAEWKKWRESDTWSAWAQARAPYVAMRRTAFAKLRDEEAVDVLFEELAERFADRDGGYLRIVRLPTRRLGDGGQQALIEFVGVNDRERRAAAPAPVVEDEAEDEVDEPTAEAPTEAEAKADSSDEPVAEAEEADAKA